MGDSSWRGRLSGEGKPGQNPVPLLMLPHVPHGWSTTLLLTSASFQSPGMQKDSSRSLPHSNKIRSSEEEGQSLQRRLSGYLGAIQPSAIFLMNTGVSISQSWGPRAQFFSILAPWRAGGGCGAETCAHSPACLQTTLAPLGRELLSPGGRVLVYPLLRGPSVLNQGGWYPNGD